MPQFHYDEQVRRFLLQFARMFSHYHVEGGIDDAGNVTYVRVPIRYGDASRQAAAILQDNSRNKMPCAPQMSFYIRSLEYDRDRIQNPTHVDTRIIRQREWDEDSQSFEQTQGNAFNVQRLMPVPHRLTIDLDIWTTNVNQKLQLHEQITTLFNPSLEIQSTDNYLDWTSLTVVERKSEKWSSRTIPSGDNGIDIDILTFTFEIPIWISQPARVTKEGVVHQVIASIFDETGEYVDAITDDDILLGTRLSITPHGYQVLLISNQLRILPYTEPTDEREIDTIPDLNSDISWRGVLDEYGTLNEGITQIRLALEDGTDIMGTVAPHPTEEGILLYNVDVDTLPSNNVSPVNAVIDPLTDGPDNGLDPATTGQRYLLLDDIGAINDPDIADAWQGLANEICPGKKNDIIEYDGQKWCVAFNAEDHDAGHGNNDDFYDPDNPGKSNPAYVANLTTGIQFKYNKNDDEPKGKWVRSYEGIYTGGMWDVVL